MSLFVSDTRIQGGRRGSWCALEHRIGSDSLVRYDCTCLDVPEM